MDKEQTDRLLLSQARRYPGLETRDLVKALYQNAFGCGHMVEETREGLEWLLREAAECGAAECESEPPLVETLGDYARVHIAAMAREGLSARTLYRLFALSARAPISSMADFCAALTRLEALLREGKLPVDGAEAESFLARYRDSGCPATHHSEAFRRLYAPAYRVVYARYCYALPVLCRIDRLLSSCDSATIAIEGRCASGKSSLAELLSHLYDCNVFHMDDFFLRPCQRTPERFAEPGGNVDRERFAEEVLTPLRLGAPFAYRPFDCGEMRLAAPVRVEPKALNIVEGSYSMHPALADAYDYAVFVDVDSDAQIERIRLRNGEEMCKRFQREWIPLEEAYFSATQTQSRCHSTVRTDEDPAAR